MVNKLVDPGEIYIVGQYELGTSTPTSMYKIGMAQNDSTTIGRVKDHQTGNPNRIFIEAIFPCQAVYLVERLMHQKWESNRVSQEWFDFTAADLAQAKLDIVNFENAHGNDIRNLRRVYYAAPTTGDHPGLRSPQITQAQTWRDEAYTLCEDMMKLKYEYSTLEYQILTTNGLNAVVDGVSSLTQNPASSEFDHALLPPALKRRYMTKTRKRKDDFRFKFTQTTSKICDLSPTASTYWQNLHSTEFAAYDAAKSAWNAMKATITPATVVETIQPRTPAIEAMYDQFIQKKMEFDEKRLELEVLKLKLRALCLNYEGIANVCSWKRGTQTNEFHKVSFKINEPTAYNDPRYQKAKAATAVPSLIKFKTW
jgi:hypothetical protein